MIHSIKGTHDFLDLTLYNFIIDQARAHFNYAHFIEITTPIIEPIELFKRTLGAHTDVISKEMFTIQQHPNSSENICLRPEATAPTTRAFLAHNIQEQPWKVFSHGPMFRYERPQKGRFRQFHQYNIEIIDSSSILHDVQMLTLLERFFTHRIHLSDYTLSINFLGCPEDRARYRPLLKAFLADHAQEICATCTIRVDTNTMRVFDCKQESCQKLYERAPFIADHLCDDCSSEWAVLQKGIMDLAIPHTYNPKLVRGLDYYNKTVFEFSSSHLGSQSAFCGGGRYELALQLGAPKAIPSIGAAFGIDRLILLLELQKDTLPLPPKPPLHVIIPLSPAQQSLALTYADMLHSHNFSVDLFLESSSIKSMMKKASKLSATYVLLLGDDEQTQHTVTIKNMLTGEQASVPKDQVVEYLKSTYSISKSK